MLHQISWGIDHGKWGFADMFLLKHKKYLSNKDVNQICHHPLSSKSSSFHLESVLAGDLNFGTSKLVSTLDVRSFCQGGT